MNVKPGCSMILSTTPQSVMKATIFIVGNIPNSVMIE
jgi:hypothetical protein